MSDSGEGNDKHTVTNSKCILALVSTGGVQSTRNQRHYGFYCTKPKTIQLTRYISRIRVSLPLHQRLMKVFAWHCAVQIASGHKSVPILEIQFCGGA